MAESAFQIQYRQELIAGFEQNQTLLRNTVTTEAVIKGNQAVFNVIDSGSAAAVTRGLNGLIPGRADNNTQNTATLKEWHDKAIKTGFNIFGSQGDQRRAMQDTTTAVINRRIDTDILTALSGATQDTGTAQKASMRLVTWGQTILGNNAVPIGGNVTWVITPAFYAYLLEVKQFSSAEYVNKKPLEQAMIIDQPISFYWLGMNWIVHPTLTGKGTNAEKCYVYHRSAIGHAIDTAGIQSEVDYNGEHDYSWARCTAYTGAVLMQNSGVVVINHDGSEFAAQ